MAACFPRREAGAAALGLVLLGEGAVCVLRVWGVVAVAIGRVAGRGGRFLRGDCGMFGDGAVSGQAVMSRRPLNHRGVGIRRHFEARLHGCTSPLLRGRTRVYREACGRRIAGAVSAMATSVGMGCRAAVAGFGGDSPVAGFHVCATIAFVRADCSHASGIGGVTPGGSVREGGGAFKFAKDGLFVCKEIAD